MHQSEHINDLSERYRLDFYPKIDKDLFQIIWFDMLKPESKEKYTQLIKEHQAYKKNIWKNSIIKDMFRKNKFYIYDKEHLETKEHKQLHVDEVEYILMSVLN